MVVNWMENLPV